MNMHTFRLIYQAITPDNTFQQWQLCFDAADLKDAHTRVDTFFRLMLGHRFAPAMLTSQWRADREFQGHVFLPHEKTHLIVFQAVLYAESDYQTRKERIQSRLSVSENGFSESDIDADVSELLKNMIDTPPV